MKSRIAFSFLAVLVGTGIVSHGILKAIDPIAVASRLTGRIEAALASSSVHSYAASAAIPAIPEIALAETPSPQEPIAITQPDAANTAPILAVASPQFMIAQQGTPFVELVPAADRPVTHAELSGILSGLSNVLALIPSAVSSQGHSVATMSQSIAANGNPETIGAGFAINQLANTNITAPAISGGSISNANVAASSLSSAGNATIGGDLSVGGNSTVSGNLDVIGNFSAGTISFAAASSSNSITTNATSTNLYAASAAFAALSAGTLSLAAGTTSSFAITSIPWGLLSTDGNGNIVATSSPTALSFTAMSMTATSTFAGGLTVGGSQFVVQQGSGYIGIGTVSPIYPFDVSGIGHFGGIETGGQYGISGGFLQSSYPIIAPTPILNYGSGQLVALATRTIAAGTSPYSVTVDSTGRYAYVANNVGNTVSEYSITQSTGRAMRESG